MLGCSDTSLGCSWGKMRLCPLLVMLWGSVADAESRALAKERQKKDNHNLSEFGAAFPSPTPQPFPRHSSSSFPFLLSWVSLPIPPHPLETPSSPCHGFAAWPVGLGNIELLLLPPHLLPSLLILQSRDGEGSTSTTASKSWGC